MSDVTNEWVEYAARSYIADQAAFTRKCDDKVDRMEVLRQRMEGVGAIRYDRDGSGTGYVDKWPELLDQMSELVESLQNHMKDGAISYMEAMDIFRRDRNAYACWLHYGAGETWRSVGARLHTSPDHLKHERGRGFRFIFDNMPARYRLVDIKAEEL